MNEDLKINRIELFLRDAAMSQAVYEVIQKAFLTSGGNKDVQYLAAERIAIDLLANAWKELSKYRRSVDKDPVELKQVGL